MIRPGVARRRIAAVATALGVVIATVVAPPMPVSGTTTPDSPDPGGEPVPATGIHSLDLEASHDGHDDALADVRTAEQVGETTTVELVPAVQGDPDSPAVFADAVEHVGGTVLSTARSGVVLADVPTIALADLETSIHGIVRRPLPLDVRPDRAPAVDVGVRSAVPAAHASVTNATAWHASGRTGSDVRIGVIDFFNVPTYWNTTTMGPRPVRNVTARCIDRGRDCSAEFFATTPVVGDDHGPAVVEIVRDVAPGATIYVGRATTESDYYELVDWFAASGVRIINRSLASRFDGPGDGRGALTGVADYAAGRGILWVNSVGNNAIDRYYRHPVRLSGDWVAFGSSGTSTWLPFRGCIAPGGVRWAGDWDLPPAQRTDYDVFIHEAPIGNPTAGRVVASSTQRQTAGAPPLETFTGSDCPGPGQQFYLRIRRVSGNHAGDVIEIIDYADGIGAHTQARHSAAVPVADSRSAGVLAVGAIDPPTQGRIAPYSSQGPTNDGRQKPDLSAPAGSPSASLGANFSGTSAAAPVVAGGAALLWSAGLAADAGSLGDLVRHTVVDRGSAGRDNVYGTGEFRLPAPPVPAASFGTPSRYVPLSSPTRVLDTRSASAVGPAPLIGGRWPGRIVDLPLSSIPGAPAGEVTAVAANVTVVGSARPGFTQAFPTAQAVLAGFSNLNVHAAGQTRPNFAVIPVGTDGRLSIYSTSGGHLVVDVLGTFVATDGPTSAGRVVPLASARRVLDTRRDGARTPLRSGQQVPVPLPTGVDPAHVAALVMNVTATETVGRGFVQALPAGRPQDIGRTSTLNLVPDLTVANTVIVPVTRDGARLYAQLGPGGHAHVIADVTAYVTSDAAPSSSRGHFVPVRPGRALDTRRERGPVASGSVVDVRGGSAPGISLPADTSAVVWNLTVTGTTHRGHLRGWPRGATEPPTSALNWVAPGVTIANAAIIRPDAAGVMRVRAVGGPSGQPLTQIVVDVFGYFT